ncbi:MAG: DNA-3-methyladenine glycosylase I [Thermoplasmata archaeon]|nr:MAG: DNA-3-methyladenine glycosylase I [Thermoplasmata archaeon]
MAERCWSDVGDAMGAYHDTEWGTPLHDDDGLFEQLVLQGFQAGLSWTTVLNKREAFRAAFDGFDVAKVAAYDETKVTELLGNADIVRNRKKIEAAISNANAFLAVAEEFGSFDAYIWGFVDGRPLQTNIKSFSEMPAETDLSRRISKDMKARGFRFIGPTIMYAFMQATGMVNDHLVGCPRHDSLRD